APGGGWSRRWSSNLPRINEVDTGVFEVLDVPGCERMPTEPADCGDFGVEPVDRAPEAVPGLDDLRVDRGGARVEWQHPVTKRGEHLGRGGTQEVFPPASRQPLDAVQNLSHGDRRRAKPRRRLA